MSRYIRLQYPFNDAGCLEVEYKPGKWARVTPDDFRSLTGNRRIDGIDYNGPIFYYKTNFKYKKGKSESFRIVGAEELNEKLRKKQVPQDVRFYDRDAKYR